MPAAANVINGGKFKLFQRLVIYDIWFDGIAVRVCAL
jgi:hypothetical protein